MRPVCVYRPFAGQSFGQIKDLVFQFLFITPLPSGKIKRASLAFPLKIFLSYTACGLALVVSGPGALAGSAKNYGRQNAASCRAKGMFFPAALWVLRKNCVFFTDISGMFFRARAAKNEHCFR
ncbi:hypothetical protein M2103_000286 [Ereboglobus sp. PH5-5]|uniref:hypothetical protein n=1 Tax=Ereboglobus sp. PH5-5 TaxID=2940529 RepID=UPI00240710BF|nr:hypothetical protein [Ereboglobus sp. PH5-5]MDF9832078.1 hypothetical protein [Ereboglobus sp. PH5-5]